MELNDFETLVGTAFDVRLGDRNVSLRLEKAEELPSHSRGGRGQSTSFSLLFAGPAGTPLWQGTFRLEHSHAAPADIFIVPVAQKNDTLLYEAVFN